LLAWKQCDQNFAEKRPKCSKQFANVEPYLDKITLTYIHTFLIANDEINVLRKNPSKFSPFIKKFRIFPQIAEFLPIWSHCLGEKGIGRRRRRFIQFVSIFQSCKKPETLSNLSLNRSDRVAQRSQLSAEYPTRRARAGLPDGLFSNQKSQFGQNLEGLEEENGVIFYDHLEYFTAIWYTYFMTI
jgi:hypothetical protein